MFEDCFIRWCWWIFKFFSWLWLQGGEDQFNIYVKGDTTRYSIFDHSWFPLHVHRSISPLRSCLFTTICTSHAKAKGCITGEEIKSIHCSESDRVYLSHLLLLMNVCKGLRIQQQLLVSIVISYMVFFGKVTALQQYRFSNYNNNVVVRKLFSSKTKCYV